MVTTFNTLNLQTLKILFIAYRPIALMATLTTFIACLLICIQAGLDYEKAHNATIENQRRIENGGNIVSLDANFHHNKVQLRDIWEVSRIAPDIVSVTVSTPGIRKKSIQICSLKMLENGELF